MDKRLQLARMMDDCPVCWQNFVDSIRPIGLVVDNPGQHIVNHLKPYNGKFNDKHHYVEFESTCDLTFFVLKFA